MAVGRHHRSVPPAKWRRASGVRADLLHSRQNRRPPTSARSCSWRSKPIFDDAGFALRAPAASS
eukprot:7910151-Pyramimonas_sp.AAC.1